MQIPLDIYELVKFTQNEKITTTTVMLAAVLSISGFFSAIGLVDATKCQNSCPDVGGGDCGRDGGVKRGCIYQDISYSDGEIVRTPSGNQMKCENGGWMAFNTGYQG
jgi:hypothetical protein